MNRFAGTLLCVAAARSLARVRPVLTASALIYIFNLLAVSATYYIAPDGTDSNDGLSFQKSVHNFNHAALLLGPGDTLLVQDGVYDSSGYFGWGADGTSDSPIVVKAAAGASPVITGPDPAGWGLYFQIAQPWYIIERLRFENCDGIQISLLGASHVIIRDCFFGKTTGTNIRIMQSSFITLDNDHFERAGDSVDQGGADNVYVLTSNHVLVQNCYFTRGAHAAMDLKDSCTYCVIRNCTVEQHWGGGLYAHTGSHHIVIENNNIAYVGEATDYPKTGIQIGCENAIVRRNNVTRASSQPIADYGIGLLAYYFGGYDQNVRHCRLYNNNIYKCGDQAVFVYQKYAYVNPDSGVEVADNKLVNNVMFHNRIAGPNPTDGNVIIGFDTWWSTVNPWPTFPHDNWLINNIGASCVCVGGPNLLRSGIFPYYG